MPDIEELDVLDQMWREGLSLTAEGMTPISDPTGRVAGRLRRRRRARAALTTAGVAILGAFIVVTVSFARGPDHVRVATSAPPVQVDVVVGPDLRIRFPGRAVSGQPPRVKLPHGLIRFRVRSTASSHHLVIDGLRGFVATVGPDTVTVTVRIPPGRYLMHCTIPGHTEAGEEALLIVE